MDSRTIPALLLGALAVACAAGAFDKPASQTPPVAAMEALPEGSEYGILQGVIIDRNDAGRIEGAVIVLQCSCLEGTRETLSNADGLYRFSDLPNGEYTVQALYGRADVSRVTTLRRGFKVRLDFPLDPQNEFIRT